MISFDYGLGCSKAQCEKKYHDKTAHNSTPRIEQDTDFVAYDMEEISVEVHEYFFQQQQRLHRDGTHNCVDLELHMTSSAVRR